MLTKQQKKESIERASKKLSENRTAVFAEFGGVSVEDFRKLRRELREVDADLKVFKKRLLNIALKNAGVDFDPLAAKKQLGTVFAKRELSSVAALIYKFSKGLTKAQSGEFSVMGVYDFDEKRVIDPNEFKAVATLPSKEVLLAQIAMMLTMPLKQVMNILEQKAKSAESGSN